MDTDDDMSTYKPDQRTFSVDHASHHDLPISPMATHYKVPESGTVLLGHHAKRKAPIPKDHHFNKS